MRRGRSESGRVPRGRIPRCPVRLTVLSTAVLLVALVAVLHASVATAAAPTFTATGSAEQVYVTGLAPNAQMSLLTSKGTTLYTQNADSLGGLLFRNVPPGKGYRVQLDPNGPKSGPITVHSDAAAPWDPDIYHQSIPDNGYTYLTTRDGTKLAIDVHPPTSPAGQSGAPSFIHLPTFPANTSYAPPYPTLIEYSGYAYADPSGPVNGIAVLANLMGFAVVDISMRGTGCSGGAYDFFEPLQNLDGYDVIETIAHQPWVLGNKVGMMGISYGGISQLFTAQLQPPDLEAIAPLSVIDATATTLYPGGILNTGFAVPWAQQRQQEAQPAGQGNAGTQPYAEQQIQNGDQTCKSNQVLHGEAHVVEGVAVRFAIFLKAQFRHGQHQNRRIFRPGTVSLQEALQETVIVRLIVLRGHNETPRLLVERGGRPPRCLEEAPQLVGLDRLS